MKEEQTKSGFLKLFTPAVSIAFFTAVVGPIIVAIISSSLEEIKIQEAKFQKELEVRSEELKNQQELQHSILIKVMDIASTEGTDIKALEKLGLLTSFINDNEDTFGLKFTYITRQLEDKQRADRDRLQTELSSKKTEISEQQNTISSLDAQADLVKKEQVALQSNLEWHKINRKENQVLQANLSSRLKEKETELKNVEKQTNSANSKLEILNSDLLINKSNLKEMTKKITSISTEKDNLIEMLREELRVKDNDFIDLRKKFSRLEINQDVHIKEDSELKLKLENKDAIINDLKIELKNIKTNSSTSVPLTQVISSQPISKKTNSTDAIVTDLKNKKPNN